MVMDMGAPLSIRVTTGISLECPNIVRNEREKAIRQHSPSPKVD